MSEKKSKSPKKKKHPLSEYFCIFLLIPPVFAAIIILLSNFVGFVWLSPLIIFVVSIILAFLIKDHLPKITIRKELIVIQIILLILLIYPILLITPIFPASNDAVSTTTMRLLEERIPLDYAQYSSINMPYPLGLPILANTLFTLVPIIPDYLSSYVIALIAGLLQVFFIYLIAKEAFKSEKAGIFAAAILLTSKFIFENIYVGELAWYLGSVFMLAFIYFFMKNSKLQYLVFPAIFASHPVAGFNTLLFLIAHFFVYNGGIKKYAKILLSLVLIIPILFVTYIPIAINLISGGSSALDFSLANAVEMMFSLPVWIGPGLTAIFVVLAVYVIYRKRQFKLNKNYELVFVSLLVIAIITTFIFRFAGFMLATKTIEMIILATILLSAAILSKIKFMQKRKYEIATIIVIIVLALFFFSTSSILNHYRTGSKIGADGREFAAEFYKFDNTQSKVLFLTKENGKLAEYSNKIPYDLYAAHSIISFDFMYYHNEAFYELEEKKLVWEQVFYDRKIELINSITVDYIVINKNEFDIELEYPIEFEHGTYIVYKK